MLYLLFYLNNDCFALDVAAVQEVLPLLEVRGIPRAPVGVAGVIAYGGANVPVIDLSELALGQRSAQLLSTRIVLVQYPDSRGDVHLLGLITERTTGTCRLDASEFKTPGIANPQARYLGDIALGPNGLVQRVEVRDLLTPAVSALLFEAPLEP